MQSRGRRSLDGGIPAVIERFFGHEGAGRDETGLDIGEIQGVELGPQHVAFEAQGPRTSACFSGVSACSLT